jgi:hypothetical protein
MDRDRRARERRLHYRLMRGIYRLCASGEWRVCYALIRGNRRLCRGQGIRIGTVGFVDPEEDVIWLDPREDVLSTFIHECLHVLVGDRYLDRHEAEEREVQRLERLMLRHLSPCQARRLHLQLSTLLVNASARQH